MPLILGAGTGGSRIIMSLQQRGEEERRMKKWYVHSICHCHHAAEVECVLESVGEPCIRERECYCSYLCCWETIISMMSMRMPTIPKTRTTARGKVVSEKQQQQDKTHPIIIATTKFQVVPNDGPCQSEPHKATGQLALFLTKVLLFHPWTTVILPLLGISVTWMKMELLNSPNLVKACILQRMCTSYSFPMCRPKIVCWLWGCISNYNR